MKPILHFACAVLFIMAALNATTTDVFAQPPQIDFMRIMRSPMGRISQQAGGRAVSRAMWEGNAGALMAFQLADEPEIREAWGITDEQHQQIKATVTNPMLFMNHPDFPALAGEMQKYVNPADIYMENATQEQLDGFAAVQEKLIGLSMEVIPAEIGKVMTEEQNQKLLEFQLASMSGMPITMPKAFEALGLSDEQKQQLDGVKKEFEADFMQLMDEAMETQFGLLDKMYEQMEKDGVEIKDLKDLQEKVMAVAKKVEELGKTDENVRRQNELFQKKGEAFTARLKFKIYDILTDEQMAKLEQLVDNPPEYVTNFLKKMKDKQGLSLDAKSPSDFMNAWKPGEPIPEEYRQKRARKAFPQAE